MEFVRLIDKYGLRGAELEQPVETAAVTALPQADTMPQSVTCCAAYLAPDGSLGLAWQEGVCALTPMECAGVDLQGKQLILHDSKTTFHQLAQLGIGSSCVFDTALAAYDLNPSQSDYPVSKLATNFLGTTVDDQNAAQCAEALWQLRPVLEQELEKNDLKKLYQDIELPLCTVLLGMEQEGILIDRGQLEQFGQMLSQRIADCEAIIFGYAGETLNINSPKQLGQLLFEQLGLPPVKKTKTGYSTNADVLEKLKDKHPIIPAIINSPKQLGQLLFEQLGLPPVKKTKTGYSTNADVLEKLKDKHPIIPAIMDYRMLSKLKSTYADGLMKQIGSDGRIHTTFQNLVTATGRLSSAEPNLQNIPVRTDLGAEIRKMFVPREGCVLVDADYSQIELRVLAHMAQDEAMQRSFREGTDIHTVTAAQVFGVKPEEVTPLQRRHAKAVNFGIVYGISEFSLAEDIGVSRYEAKAYIDSYLNTYPGVRNYMKQVVRQARELGYTQTLYGRRRYIPELSSSNFNIRSGAERIALNTPIQGTAADIIKLAMLRVDAALRQSFPEARLLLQVHDELIVECPEEQAQAVAQLVSQQMESAAQLDVPLTAEAKIGKSWYEAK